MHARDGHVCVCAVCSVWYASVDLAVDSRALLMLMDFRRCYCCWRKGTEIISFALYERMCASRLCVCMTRWHSKVKTHISIHFPQRVSPFAAGPMYFVQYINWAGPGCDREKIKSKIEIRPSDKTRRWKSPNKCIYMVFITAFNIRCALHAMALDACLRTNTPRACNYSYGTLHTLLPTSVCPRPVHVDCRLVMQKRADNTPAEMNQFRSVSYGQHFAEPPQSSVCACVSVCVDCRG